MNTKPITNGKEIKYTNSKRNWYKPDEPVFCKNKEQYKRLLIAYDNSPTGKAYPGLSKRPFMKTRTGIGFQGVVLQDEDRQKVQCYMCGSWKCQLNTMHLKKCSGLNKDEYKEKFGINRGTSLISDETLRRMTNQAIKNGFKVGNPYTKNTWKASKARLKNQSHSIEYMNKYGTCPDQLRERLFDFIRTRKMFPTGGNGGGPMYHALRQRYGSWNNALEAHGLPRVYGRGGARRFLFKDGSVHQYNNLDVGERIVAIEVLLKKCPFILEGKYNTKIWNGTITRKKSTKDIEKDEILNEIAKMRVDKDTRKDLTTFILNQ